VRHTVLAYLWVVALVAYVQRAAISVPLAEIGRDVHAADTVFGDATRALGFLQSAWLLGYALLQLPAGGLADRIGGRRTLVLLAVLWSVATAVAACMPGYWSLLAAWTLMGALQAGVFPCAVRSIGQVFGEREQARASGWLGSGMLAGGALAPVLTAWLLGLVAPWEAATGFDRWRICLVLYCLPGLAWAAAYWFGTRSLGLDRVRGPVASRTARHEPLRGAWTDRSLWLLSGQHFLRAAAMIFFVTWFPTFLRETRGVSIMESGLLTTYAGVAAMLGVVCGGYCSDWLLARTGSKRIARQGLAATGMAVCAALMVASFFVRDVSAAIALISAGAFVACFGGVAGYTVAIDYGGERVGMVFGVMNMAGAFGGMLFPVTVGWLVSVTGTWNAALFAFAALMAIDAVLWALLNPRGRFLEPT
jgi:MFS family permease